MATSPHVTIPTVSTLTESLQRLAPLEYAESWDKVGLLVGDHNAPLARSGGGNVLLTIDLTEDVLAEAIDKKSSAIVAYHPPIFEPLAKVTDITPRQRIIFRAVQAGIAIYSPHTALDAVPGGVTDWLCEGLSRIEGKTAENGKVYGDCRALVPYAKNPASQQVKIVTFVPEDDVERVRSALASAGAGRIGDYNLCSFAVPGTGTFLGNAGTRPSVGEPERLESVREVRLEMVCGRSSLPLAMELLRSFHPYEEPAIDVFELVAKPQRSVGAGRRLVLDRPATVPELAMRLKKWIGSANVTYAMPTHVEPGMNEEGKRFSRLGVVPGSGESLSRLARTDGCEVFITGEMKHHEVLGALHAGMAVILGGHTNTERGYLVRFADRLRAELLPRGFAGEVLVSTRDRDFLVPV